MRIFALIALIAVAILSAFTQSFTGDRLVAVSPTPPKQTAKPTPKRTSSPSTAAKPKITPKKPDEKTEWDKAIALTDPTKKIAALKKFNTTFPKSTNLDGSLEMIATLRASMAAEKAGVGDVDAAADLYMLALNEGPAKFTDAAFNDKLARAPSELYFRGDQSDANEIAKLLEDKAEGNAAQLTQITQFYLATENGADAKRTAEKAIAIAPNAVGYLTLGTANRMQFAIDDAAAAYAKALETDPDSIAARRGLAEMKRALGKADEAAKLYQEILAKDEKNAPARTGLIMAMFEGGKRADAEGELQKEIDANPSNVILLASAAYWYAANNDGAKAVDLAQKAVAADPRFVWSHLALARGLMAMGRPADAEKTILGARRYGNFPTVRYELASARLALGFYREAAEELADTFSVVDGQVRTKLGGRVARDAKGFTELLDDERRASIFAPIAADTTSNSAQLAALLAFQQELDNTEPNPERIAKAADELAKGNDSGKAFRQIYAAGALIDKGVALQKAIEIAKDAANGIETALDSPNAATKVLASELYANRQAAMAKGEYVRVPDVPRTTLSAVLRGRVEEIQGWAMLQTDDKDGGLVRLRRAVGVFPVNSSYWREATWRLGAALASSGKDAEALDSYIKSYKDGPVNGFRYSVIKALYKRINGGTDGLEGAIGQDPNPPEMARVEATPTPEPVPSASPTPDAAKPEIAPSPTPTTETASKPDAIKPCTLTSSEDSLTLTAGGDLAVIIGTDDDRDLDAITATPSSPTDVSVTRDAMTGVKTRAQFVVKSLTTKPGLFQVRFELPCGKKELVVKVR